MPESRSGIGARLDAFEAQLPNSQPFFERYLSRCPSQLAACLIFALALRIVTFGDPAIHIDESFYFLVGQRMHLGELPYVDLWDRKPFGLFALYYIFAGISDSVIAYQVAAWLAAAFTGFALVRMTSRWTGPQGALLAGLAYLALLNVFEGIGGQSPVFYNLLIAGAALLMVRSLDSLQAGRVPPGVYAAMALSGLAMTVKQTTLFESVFFGLFVIVTLVRSGKPFPWGQVACLAMIGAVPTLAISAFYYLNGHWSEYWGAMVTSNLTKKSASAVQYLMRTVNLILLLWPILLLVIISIRASLHRAEMYRPFLIYWTIAALIGFISIPNLYSHYCLPLMVPFTAIAATELDRRTIGTYAFAMIAALAVLSSKAYNLPRHRDNAANMAALADMIRNHSPAGTFLAYDAPPMLYSLSGTQPLSPLLFPNHFNHEIERNVSHLDTAAEFRRVLSERPGAVAIVRMPRVRMYNRENLALVEAYVRDHCRRIGGAKTHEIGREDMIWIYGDCH